MRAALHNLGCKTNSYETEAMEQALKEAGYEIVDFAGDEPADVYIVNTCSVTNIADRKSRQMLHKARTMNPSAAVVAVGCFVQTADKERLKEEGIDICLGTADKGKLTECLDDFFASGKRSAVISDLKVRSEYEPLRISDKQRHTRAFIKIEDGCDQYCTFCIIPYARGHVRSRKISDVISEVSMLAKASVREIVLTGINMSAYGSDLDDLSDMAQLLLAIQEIKGIERIRISSLEPGLVSREFLEKIKACGKLCRHFHLSLQSGSDGVLKRMNRNYTSLEYLDKCELLREYFEEPSITTDVIVGFPGESEAEFEETLEFVRKVGFFDMHIFAYSQRNGTPAAKMPNQIQSRVKRLRSAILIKEAEEMKRNALNLFLGKRDTVLLEEARGPALCPEEAPDGDGMFYIGHTDRYVKVIVPKREEGLEGKMLEVRLDRVVRLQDGEAVVRGIPV